MNLLSRIVQKNHTYYVLTISFWVILCGVGLNSCALDEDDPQIFSEILTYRDILHQCGATTSCESDEPEAILYNNGLLQYPARLSLIYYTKLYPDSVLQLKLNSLPRKTHTAISVETDSGKSETFYLKNRKEQQIDLSRFSGKIVKMTIAALPLSSKTLADSAKLEWSKIQLAVSLENRKPGELEASPSLQPNLQIALQKLRTYDVIYLVFDAFHAKHSNVYGYPKETTPFLAQLSQEAFIFEYMFANAPYTLASTASLFTSKYPFDHGLTSMSSQLGKIFPTINELLMKSGIETCLITNHGFF